MLLREDGRTPFYIGKGRGNRWLVHERKCWIRTDRKSRIIRRILEQQGFVYRIKVAVGLSNELAMDLEKTLIASYGRLSDGPLVNLTDGGEGLAGFSRSGWAHSEETRQKISAANSGENHWAYGKPCKENTRIAVGKSAKGRPTSDETRQKKSEASMGNKSNLGRKFTDEHREKIRQAMRGKRLSAETRAKISEARRAR